MNFFKRNHEIKILIKCRTIVDQIYRTLLFDQIYRTLKQFMIIKIQCLIIVFFLINKILKFYLKSQ